MAVSNVEDSKRNLVLLNQACQDTIQDIVCKAQEIFQVLKMIPLPNGTPATSRSAPEKLNKLKEHLETIEKLFSRLRVIYTELQKFPVELEDVSTMIPLLHTKESDEQEKEKPIKSQKEQMFESKKKELEEQLRIKNLQIKKLTAILKTVVWDMNSIVACLGITTT